MGLCHVTHLSSLSVRNYVYEPCPKCVSNGKDSRGDNLVAYANGHSHCFACGYHVYPKFFKPILEKPIARKELLPVDFTREVPTDAWKWVLQYGLPYTHWKDCTGYSEAEGKRLVFLVGNPVAFSIGRLLEETDGEHKRRRKWYVWGDSHKHAEIFGEQHGSDRVVVVEDLISAHKVGEINTVIPLFGTVPHPCHYHYLRQARKPVVLWLDKDQELNMKRTAMRMESIIDMPVTIQVTDKDPKALTLEEIHACITNVS